MIPRTTYVRPGATGQILLTVPNSADSAGPMQGVTVTATAPSSIVISSATLGPVNIDPGSNYVFTISYAVAPDAPDGEADISLNVSGGAGAVPPTYQTSIAFTVGEVPFLIGAQLRAVWQSEAFDGLKFREERRAYRQAGRQVLKAVFFRTDWIERVRPQDPVAQWIERLPSKRSRWDSARRAAGQGRPWRSCVSPGADPKTPGAIDCGGWIYTSENPGPATDIREAREASKASQALVMVRAEARGITRASSPNGTRFFRPERRFYRLAALAEARKVMSQPSVRIGEDSNQRLAKPSAYRPKGGKPTVCSLAEKFGQNHYVVGARPHRAPPSFRTVINLPGVAVVLRRAPPPLALPAVGELTLAMRRGFLFLGKAGKKDRGAMK